MYTVSRRGGYGPRKYIVDLTSDINELPTHGIPPGSIAFVIENSTHYMLNNQRKWTLIQFSSSSNGGSGGGEGEGGDSFDEVIYDGGLLDDGNQLLEVVYDGGVIG